MRFKDVFSIIGPSMIGPSSSHTAGAVRLGRIARSIHGGPPAEANIVFYGSFAETYAGHGTDVAVVAGILDWDTDDERIPRSIEIAGQMGIRISFKVGTGRFWHPNTMEIKLAGANGETALKGSSIGGGNVQVFELNDFSVKFTGSCPTLIVRHADRPGMIAEMAQILQRESLNIGHMDVDRKGRSGEAMTVVELDSAPDSRVLHAIGGIEGVLSVSAADLEEERDR